MLKHVADLSDQFNYLLVFGGQSNSRPWGTKAQAFTVAPELQLDQVGVDLTGIVIVSGVVNTIEDLTIGTALSDGEWNVGSFLRLGTTTAPLAGYAQVLLNFTLLGVPKLRVKWLVAATPATVSGYLVREDYKWAAYPQVRILTPYQPFVADEKFAAGAGGLSDAFNARSLPYPSTVNISPFDIMKAADARRLLTPGFVTPAGVTSFADMGLFLPLTFAEGIDSYGVSDRGINGAGSETISTVTATSFTLGVGVGAPLVDYFTQGYVRVDWHDGTNRKLSWARIASNTATVFTLVDPGGPRWLGDGEPTQANITRFTIWVPHYNNSPYAYLPGEGFTYPNNNMQPYAVGGGASIIGAAVHNRPRGITGFAQGDRFGAMLNMGMRLSAATGKVVDIVYLGINSSSLFPAQTWNAFGFPGIVGWWNFQEDLDWWPVHVSGPTARLKHLLTTVVPNAYAAEGNTKAAKVLAFGWAQGEADALQQGLRESYDRTLATFVSYLRDLVTDLGMSPYANGAKIPWVQLRVSHVPYELSGTFTLYGLTFTFSGDAEGIVNNAIFEFCESDGFGAFTETNDLVKLVTDPLHFDGSGEATNGARLGEAMGELIEYALSFGSTCLQTSLAAVVRICNSALAQIGELQIATLDENTVQAQLCRTFYSEVRDSLLATRQWSFGLKRKAAVEVKGTNNQWQHTYVVPGEAKNVIALIPAEATDDYVQAVLGFDMVPAAPNDRVPVDFVRERAAAGHELIRTNLENAHIRYVLRVVDASRFSEMFAFAVAMKLAAFLAGAIIKGDAGEAVAARCLQKAAGYLKLAASQDGRQRQVLPAHLAPWQRTR